MKTIRFIQKLLKKTGDIFEWSYVEKAQFLYFSSFFVAIYIIALILLVELMDLMPQHDLDGAGSIQLMMWATLYAVIILFAGLLGFPLRKRNSVANWYVHLSIQLYCLANVIILYYLGIFSIGTGVALAGGPITGMILFQRHVVTAGLISGSILAIALFFFTANGTIPYAPIISDPGQSHTNLAWILVVSGLVVPHLFLLVTTAAASISRWQEREERVRFLSSTDVLTQVANRRHLMDQFDIELSRAQRDKTAISVLMVDMDHFKPINDNYGHQVGDIALKVAANILKETVRKTDLVGRYGGEEFCIILPGANNEAAMQTAERCREKIESAHIKADEGELTLTASFGLTTVSPEEISSRDVTMDGLLKAADTALYAAKEQGRNCVITAPYS